MLLFKNIFYYFSKKKKTIIYLSIYSILKIIIFKKKLRKKN